jgi:hypothetical protein
MNSDITPVAAMNGSAFRRRAGNDAKFIREQIELFQRVYPRQLELVREAARRCDAERLLNAARELKRTVAYYGAESAILAVAALEEKGRRGDIFDVDEYCYSVEIELERLCCSLMSFDLGGAH